MFRKLAITLFLSSLLFIYPNPFSHAQEIKIDHVISVVKDLDVSIHQLKRSGFSVKKGTLHDNGLHNAHIKFWNSTSYELMSIEGVPSDDIAKKYAQLLAQKEGGVYVAISGLSTQKMQQYLDFLEIKYQTIEGKLWNYITFIDEPSLAHFFFIDYHIYMDDPPEVLNHPNSASSFDQVWVEGDDQLIRFLKGIGLKSSGTISDLELGFGERFITESGNLIIVPPKNIQERPRIKSVSFLNKDQSKGFEIRY